MGGTGSGERSPGGRGDGLILFIFAPLARFVGALVVVLLPLVLGYIGLHQYLSQPAAAAAYGHGWADTAFYDLQLPVLAAAPVEGTGPYPVPLGIARLLAPAMRQLRDDVDPERPGGAYLLGLRRLGVVAHGRFTRRGFQRAIEVAAHGVEEDVISAVRSALAAAGALRSPAVGGEEEDGVV